MTVNSLRRPVAPSLRAGLLVALFVAELAALALAYQVLTRFECTQVDAVALCRGLQSAVARAIALIGAAAVMAWARPQVVAALLAVRGGPRAALVHLAGVALLFVPVAMAPGGELAAVFGPALLPWGLGAGMATAGGLLWLAPVAGWRRLAHTAGPGALAVLLVAALLPDAVRLVAPLWDIQGLTALTFRMTAVLLALVEPALTVDPATAHIGAGDFVVQVASSCSGIEGLVLVTGFSLLYAVLFRGDLRLGRFLLVVLPLALLASWMLNALRIAVLILIGARVSPDLALNGFHSHAGWVFFSAVALAVIGVAEAVPWLHRAPRPARLLPLRADPVAALVLPFVAFMLVSLLTHALAEVPETAYPLRVMVLAPVVLLFLPVWRQWDWRPALLPVTAGLAVGAVWIVLAPATQAGPDTLAGALTALPSAALTAWIGFRLLGTVLLVPLVEEAFFRGYLLARMAALGRAGQGVGLLVTTAAFAALHGAWGAAIIAGGVFGLIWFWRRRVTDAVWSHLAANLLVAAWAIVTGDFALI